jgi:cytochrome c551/c552
MTAMKRIKTIVKWSLPTLVIALGAIQLVPVDRTNPPVETEVPATAEQRAVLRRACYDCHSNETVWPWYSRIAPVSFLVAHDVHEGRRELNLSTWNRYTAERQLKKLKESEEQVAQGEMHMWIYLPLHPNARLSAEDRALLRAWSQSAGSRASSGQ